MVKPADRFYREPQKPDRWASIIVWTICIIGCATWVAAIYIAGHFVHKFW
jgi:hypothetical protein